MFLAVKGILRDGSGLRLWIALFNVFKLNMEVLEEQHSDDIYVLYCSGVVRSGLQTDIVRSLKLGLHPAVFHC